MYNTLISAEDLLNISENQHTRILDCRFRLGDTNAGRKMFAEGHIPGAQYIHLDDDLSGPIISGQTGRHPLPSIAQATDLWSRLGIDETVQVVVYDDVGGAIAARAWWMLRWLGHENVAVLNGGLAAWISLGGTLQQEIMTVSFREFKANEQKGWIVNVEELEQLRQNTQWAIVDSRTPERYRGEKEPIDPIAGHIPDALNAPHPNTIGTDGVFKSVEELAELYKDYGLPNDSEKTVFYCGSGVTACRNILAYSVAGHGIARLYAGSWSEWIIDPERPIGTIE